MSHISTDAVKSPVFFDFVSRPHVLGQRVSEAGKRNMDAILYGEYGRLPPHSYLSKQITEAQMYNPANNIDVPPVISPFSLGDAVREKGMANMDSILYRER